MHPLPLPNGFLVSLDSPAFGSLATETQGAENSPDMAGMVLHSGQVFDKAGHTGQSPKLSLVTLLYGTLEQGPNNLVELSLVQPGFWTGRSLTGQRLLPATLPCVPPAIDYLLSHAQAARHLGYRDIALKHPRRFTTPTFQKSMIPMRCHA
jgi:hypothetical protein